MRRQPESVPKTQFLSTRFFTLLLALCALLALPAAAQQPTDTPTEAGFTEIIDVRVINLEVVVEDKDGVRVHDLRPEDFELLVDGAEVPIEYFTEVVGGVAAARQGAGADATVPAQVPGEPVATSYLLFIDDYFSITRDRDRVLDSLIEQLPNIRPQDQMAVVAFDGKGVEMLSNWTSSVNALTRTLKEAQRRDAQGLLRIAEQRAFRSEEELAAEGLGFDVGSGVTTIGDLSPSEEYYARLLAGQVERGVMAATATLRSFAQPPGRKVMLLLSGGWPADPVHFVITDPVRAATQTRVPRDGTLLGPLVETANRLGYTLYPIDVPGIEPNGVDASVATIEVSEFRQAAGTIREQEHQATLYRLAEETGGKALVNSLRDDALERVVADVRSYYWIGFTPSWKGDDSQHSVKVRVRGQKKYDIRTRENFSDLSRSTEIDMMVESTLRFGGTPGGVPLTAEVGRGKSAGWGKREVPLKVDIPLDALTFLPTADGYTARAELRIAVLDESGETADIPVIPLELTSQRPPVGGEMLPYETALKMRNKKHDLVVSIYDNASGRILAAKLEVKEK